MLIIMLALDAAQKGIAGRGVLLDWAGWKESKNETFDAFTPFNITVSELDAVASWQGLSRNFISFCSSERFDPLGEGPGGRGDVIGVYGIESHARGPATANDRYY